MEVSVRMKSTHYWRFSGVGSKRPIFLSVIIYVIGLVVGYTSSVYSISINENISELYNVKDKLSYGKILKNNLYVIAYEMFGSVLLLPTINSLFFSGFTLGLVLTNLISARVEFKKSLILVLPHGIFEIPAIIIAGAAGFKIPYEIIRYLAGKKEQILIKEDIQEYLTLGLISAILIVIAAWIEANITLKIAKAMLKAKGI